MPEAKDTTNINGAIRFAQRPIEHPLKAAALLYSSPKFVLRGPIHIIFVIIFVTFAYSLYGRINTIVSCPLTLATSVKTVQAPASGYVRKIVIGEGDEFDAFTDLMEIQFQTTASQMDERAMLKRQQDDMEDEERYLAQNSEQRVERIEHLKKNHNTYIAEQELLQGKLKEARASFQAEIETAGKMALQAELQVVNKETQVDDAERNIGRLRQEEQYRKKTYNENEKLFKEGLITGPELNTSKEAYEIKLDAVAQALSTKKKLENEVSQLKISLSELEARPNRLLAEREAREIRLSEEALQLQNRIHDCTAEISKLQHLNNMAEEKQTKRKKDLEEKLMTAGNLLKGVRFEDGFCIIQREYSGLVTSVLVQEGELVNLGKPLFTVKMDTESIYARVLVQNRDISGLKLDQEVKIKYFAYPYQEYGVRSGKIFAISTRPSSASGEEGMYVVKVALNPEDDRKREPNLRVRLTLGLAGQAEIITERRRLIEVLFTPISRFFAKEDVMLGE